MPETDREAWDAVVAGLQEAGLTLHTRLLRGPLLPHESGPQAFLLAVR